ncbi:MAG: helix-turn-helix transcriptional regulator [Nitriliruptoraceae bacterium]
MSAASDVARMLTLVPWLLERPGASLKEIAAAFDVDEDTVRRDLSHLDFCGLPGLGGGDLFEVELTVDRVVLRMADELRRPLRPTASEALRLVVTVDAVAQALGEELPALATAVERLRAALDIPERAADVVEPEATEALPLLRAAIAEGHQVELDYQGRSDDAPQRRRVDPWALHLAEGSWYLQGYDVGAADRRNFRLDRIAAARTTGRLRQVAAVPPQLEPPRYVPGPDDLEVVLRATPRGRWVLDAVTADEVVDHADGSVTVHLRTDAPRWVAQLVVMAAGEVTVLSPRHLVELVVAHARSGLDAVTDHPGAVTAAAVSPLGVARDADGASGDATTGRQ